MRNGLEKSRLFYSHSTTSDAWDEARERNEGRQKADQRRKSGNAVNTRSQGSASRAVAKHEDGKRQEGGCKTKYMKM
jgi:hypothetical protein